MALVLLRAFAADQVVLWSETTLVGAVRHEIALVLRQDGLSGRESLVLSDEIGGSDDRDILGARVQIGYASGSTTPSSLRIEILVAERKIPSGEVTARFPDSLVKLNGRSSSSAEGDRVLAAVQVSRGVDALKPAARGLSDGTVVLRVGMSDKSWLDIAVPAAFFRRSFSLGTEELSSLRAAKGL